MNTITIFVACKWSPWPQSFYGSKPLQFTSIFIVPFYTIFFVKLYCYMLTGWRRGRVKAFRGWQGTAFKATLFLIILSSHLLCVWKHLFETNYTWYYRYSISCVDSHFLSLKMAGRKLCCSFIEIPMVFLLWNNSIKVVREIYHLFEGFLHAF